MLAWIVAVAVVLGGCSADETFAPTVAPTLAPLPTPATTTYALRTTGWYAGLVIHLDDAVSVIDESGGVVAVQFRFENPGDDPLSLDAPLSLVSGARSVGPVRGTEVPAVPAGTSVGVTVEFDVDGTFDLAVAAVRIGRSDEHAVVVPLIAGSQDAVTLEPVAVDLAGSATVGSLTVRLSGAVLRADLPDWGLEVTLERLALTVSYSAQYRGTFGGGFAFTGDQIGLRLPDGTIIAAREDGHSQSIVLLKPGAAVPGLSSRFEVPLPGTGSYALIIRDGKLSVPLAFQIEESVPGG